MADLKTLTLTDKGSKMARAIFNAPKALTTLMGQAQQQQSLKGDKNP